MVVALATSQLILYDFSTYQFPCKLLLKEIDRLKYGMGYMSRGIGNRKSEEILDFWLPGFASSLKLLAKLN
jgi:hypothetical protein